MKKTRWMRNGSVCVWVLGVVVAAGGCRESAGPAASPTEPTAAVPPTPEAFEPAVVEIWAPEIKPAADAPQYHVSVNGQADNLGTVESPWDLAGALSGQHPVEPGSVVWIRGGTYIFPVRDSVKGGNGFAVSLSGEANRPVHLRAFPGERVTIDGGFNVDASHLWIWDLEFALGEDWRPREPSPDGQGTHFNTPTGVLNIVGKEGIRVINCISRHNHMGVGFWKWVKDGEIHGCIIYDNGFLGTDRPHGPALYTQNQTETTRWVTDNLIGGNYSLPLQTYGSNMGLMVNDFVIEGNVMWAPRQEAGGRAYALCGGGASSNIVVRDNLLWGYQLRVGSAANQVAEGNVVVRGDFSAPFPEKNTLLPAPTAADKPLVVLRPNKYDPRRAHLVVSNWELADHVTVDLSAFLKRGEAYRILSPFDFHGRPLVEGVADGNPVRIPLPTIPWALMDGDAREFGVFIIMKSSS